MLGEASGGEPCKLWTRSTLIDRLTAPPKQTLYVRMMVYDRAVRTTVSIADDLFEQADREATRRGLNRSEFTGSNT